MVGANAAGLIGMSKEHLAISLALSVPIVICITKIDMTPANVLAETIKHVVKVLKSPGCRLVKSSRLRLGTLTPSKAKLPSLYKTSKLQSSCRVHSLENGQPATRHADTIISPRIDYVLYFSSPTSLVKDWTRFEHS
jgi:hypothetical protein